MLLVLLACLQRPSPVSSNGDLCPSLGEAIHQGGGDQLLVDHKTSPRDQFTGKRCNPPIEKLLETKQIQSLEKSTLGHRTSKYGRGWTSKILLR